MRLGEWIDTQPRGAKAKLARDAQVQFNTILYLIAGKHVPSFETARAVSAATGGIVTIEELCTRTAAKPSSRARRRSKPRAAAKKRKRARD